MFRMRNKKIIFKYALLSGGLLEISVYTLQVLLSELQSTESWLNKHISDFSGFHYRQFLLSTLRTQSENLKEQFSIQYISLIQKEYQCIVDQVVTFPGHEALWNYRLVHLMG